VQPRRSYSSLISEARASGAGEVDAVSGVELDLEEFTNIRFGQDRRLEEVSRMLCSSNIPSVRLLERPELKYVCVWLPTLLYVLMRYTF
jgi:anaphase-promoting complex subunit 1